MSALAESDLGAVVLFDPDEEVMRVAAADGPRASLVVGTTVPDSCPAAEEAVAPEAPSLTVRLASGDRAIGSLILSNEPGGRRFTDGDRVLLELFAAQAAVAIDYTRVRDDQQRLAVLEDRERLGRELQDGAIQALFAVGMGLQGMAMMTADPALRKCPETTVGQVDEVIRDLCNYISAYGRARRPTALSVGRLGARRAAGADTGWCARLTWMRRRPPGWPARRPTSCRWLEKRCPTSGATPVRRRAGSRCEGSPDLPCFRGERGRRGMGASQPARDGRVAGHCVCARRRDHCQAPHPGLRGPGGLGAARLLVDCRCAVQAGDSMFLKSITELAVDFDDVRVAMLRDPRHWLIGLAAEAGDQGDRLLIDVGLEVGGHEVSRRARLEMREPMTTDRVASVPLRLRVEDHERLFPSLQGSLDAAWLGPGRTHLAMSASYDPPFGMLGRAVDRTLAASRRRGGRAALPGGGGPGAGRQEGYQPRRLQATRLWPEERRPCTLTLWGRFEKPPYRGRRWSRSSLRPDPWVSGPFLSLHRDGDWRRLSWAEVRRHVLQVAAGLMAEGVSTGDRVALFCENRFE